MRVNEDTFSIQIRDGGQSGALVLEERALHELHKEWGRSPMPSYQEALAAGELQDLVAFLVSLRGATP